jgi:predicted outer membrane repeat protein
MTLIDCTVANNTATFGGGIDSEGVLTLLGSTVAGNSADAGGGINDEGEMTAANSIIAGNTSDDIETAGTPVNSLGFNLVGETDGSAGWISTDLTGTVAKPLNPKLGPLANNGGPTQTLLPQPGSPAINHGSNALVPAGLTTDQRGLPRIVGGTVDIGAVEV